MKKLRSILIGLLVISTLFTSTASALDVPDVSNFTPENRPTKAYYRGIPGLLYPSFNNFTNNPNIPLAEDGDERKFLTGKYCPEGVCSTVEIPINAWWNSLPIDPDDEIRAAEVGDKIRFSVYFHNNGADRYDNDDARDSEDARNVRIGINLNDIVDPTNNQILRPLGFIYADNNQYHRNIDDKNSALIGYEVGDYSFENANSGAVARTATDDMQIKRANENLVLKPLGAIGLTMALNLDEKGDAISQDFDLNEGQEITLPIIAKNGDIVEVKATARVEGDTMWVEFDRIPGCFRYSGFVYFEAVVEELPPPPENVCEELELDDPLPITIRGREGYMISPRVSFSENIPSGTEIRWTATNGEFFDDRRAEAEPDTPESELWSSSAVYPFAREVYFAPGETATLTAEVVGSPQCKTEIEIVVEPPDLECADIIVEYQDPIYPGFYTEFVARAIDDKGNPYDAEIIYEDKGYGNLTKAKPKNTEANPSDKEIAVNPENNKFVANIFSTSPEMGTNISIPENLPTSSEIQKINSINIPAYSMDIDFSKIIEEAKTEGTFTGPYASVIPSTEQGTKSIAIPQQTYTLNPDDFVLNTEDFGVNLGINITDIIDKTMTDDVDGSGTKTMTDDVDGSGVEGTTEAGLKITPEMLDIIRKGDVKTAVEINLSPEIIEKIVDLTEPTEDSLEVNQGETVYYVPDRPSDGKDAICVRVKGTPKGGVCEECFPVEKPDVELVCKELKLVEVHEETVDTLLTEVKPGEVYKIAGRANFDPAEGTDTVTYQSDSGVFTPIPDFSNLLPVAFDQISEETRQILTEEIMKAFLLEAGITSTNYDDLNLNLIETNIGINYPIPLGKNITVENGTPVFFITFTDATATDKGLRVNTTNIGSDICLATVPLVVEEIPLICEDLTVLNLSGNTTSLLGKLEADTTYKLAGVADFNNAEEEASQRIRFSSTQGVFLVIPAIEDFNTPIRLLPEGERQLIFEELLADKIASEEIRSDNYQDIEITVGSSISLELEKEVTVRNRKKVFFITFEDAVTTDDALVVEVVGTDVAACRNTFDLEKIIEPVCLDLSIVTPAGTWRENDFTDDDEQKFEIEVETNEVASIDDYEYHWDVSPSRAGDWSKGEVTDASESNPLVNFLEDIDVDEEPEVTIEAVDIRTGRVIPACSDSVKLQVEEEEEPEIEKFVYDTKGERWRNTINIAGRTDDLKDWLDDDYRYVTYLAEYEVGSSKSVDIWERNLENGSIESKNYSGELEFEGLVIAIDSKEGDDYIIYKSDDFDENRYNDEKIGSDQISDYDDFDLDDYDKYSCEEADNDVVCIENDIEDIDRDFRNGEKIRFRNTENAEKIYIIYQLENQTDITDENCKNIMEDAGSCGERFDNTIEFEASRDNDIDDESDIDYEGDNSARIIVICPFVLARQGGEVFFHSEIDTGIDIAQCTEVKGSEPPVIIPEPPTPKFVPKTGTGEEIVFQTPTHDVCKLSNTDDPTVLAEYRNVLSNFSSSVCELQAEVAADWKERNITDAINANIERISRFGRVTNRDITLRSRNDLNTQGFSNLESGVYVVEGGDLTIDSNTGFLIKGDSTLPAAQTYIVIDGDLIINSDIKYDDSSINPTNPSSFPSAAFIVIDGNIKISNDVTELDGIYMAVDTDRSGGDGQINSKEDKPTFENTLTVSGSLIGDVYNVFYNRRAIGDPLKDEGAITVRYDERILLNTPPGLNDLIDIAQLRVAN